MTNQMSSSKVGPGGQSHARVEVAQVDSVMLLSLDFFQPCPPAVMQTATMKKPMIASKTVQWHSGNVTPQDSCKPKLYLPLHAKCRNQFAFDHIR